MPAERTAMAGDDAEAVAVSRRFPSSRDTGSPLLYYVSAALMLLAFGVVWATFPVDTADSTADWLVTKAAVEGLDPYADLRDLADHFDTEYVILLEDRSGASRYVHPRTPGALVLQLPLVFMGPEMVHTLMVAMLLASVFYLLVVAMALARVDPRWIVVAAPWIALSAAVHIGALLGTQSALVGALIVAAWVRLRRGESRFAGVLLGLAATLKVFPVLLLIPLFLFHRTRSAAALLATAVSVQIAGSLIFGLSPGDAISGLVNTSSAWTGFGANGSVARVLVSVGIDHAIAGVVSWSVVAVAAYYFARRYQTLDGVIAVVLTLSLLGSPLSWEHYDVILIPVVGWAWSRNGNFLNTVGLAFWMGILVLARFAQLTVQGSGPLGVGVTALVGRCLLLLVLVSILETDRVGGDGHVANSRERRSIAL